MAHMQRKSLSMPDEERSIPNGAVQIWELGDFVRFEDRGLHDLKGVKGARQVWAFVSA